jgi:hypothetical protein
MELKCDERQVSQQQVKLIYHAQSATMVWHHNFMVWLLIQYVFSFAVQDLPEAQNLATADSKISVDPKPKGTRKPLVLWLSLLAFMTTRYWEVEAQSSDAKRPCRTTSSTA